MSTRRTVTRLAGPGVRAARDVYLGCPVDVLRVAALVDIAGAAATLARTVVKLRHLDPAILARHVADPADLRAVLGRGRWLPTMTRHVINSPEPLPGGFLRSEPSPVGSASVRRRAARRAGDPNQLALFVRAAGGR